MIPEAPYLFSIATLSVSLAGFAGLVAAFRRGAELRQMDLFRLREIAEFGFANAVLALSLIPLSSLPGGTASAVRIAAAFSLVYLLAHSAVLVGRWRRNRVPVQVHEVVIISVLNVAILITIGITTASGAMAAYQSLLLLLLARPMTAFLFVLAALPERERAGPR